MAKAAIIKRFCIALLVAFLLTLPYYSEGSSTSCLQSQSSVLVFADNFESESNWSLFEEIVNNSECYTDEAGSATRNDAYAFEGLYGLRVWANEVMSPYSNHLIAYKAIPPLHQYGLWKYIVHVYLDPAATNQGQTGPEFSMQNTRLVDVNEFRTSTAGVQYLANPFDPNYQHWNVWHEQSPGIAGWTDFATENLTTGVWYTLTLEVDYSSNAYVAFSIEGDGTSETYDMSSYRIAEEEKFTEKAFIITLEGENLWNNCGEAAATHYRVFYDDVWLEHSVFREYLPLVQR